jgi:LmbE family N-acetylglucosaminyl deacetylase
VTVRTLMAVHAHPDDEVISTGGVLALYSGKAVRTVVVTCTDGSQGYGPGGTLPGESGHDLDAVAKTRSQELERSCSLLGVAHVERLGYRDSGMMGWPGNEAPDAFCNVPVEQAAVGLSALIERYAPHVVVTYDANGGYGHPDHIQTHRVTMAALVDGSHSVSKLYFTARSEDDVLRMAQVRDKLNLGPRPGRRQRAMPAGVPNDAITTVVDTSSVVHLKRAALEAHASQLADTVWVKASDADFDELFGHETFVRVKDETGAVLPETDLFLGL